MARAQAEADTARFWLSFIRLVLGGLVAVGSGALAGATLWYFASSPTPALPDLGPTLLTADGGTAEPAPERKSRRVTLVPAPAGEGTTQEGTTQEGTGQEGAGQAGTAPPKLAASDLAEPTAEQAAERAMAAVGLPPPPILVPEETLHLSWMEEPPIERHDPAPGSATGSATGSGAGSDAAPAAAPDSGPYEGAGEEAEAAAADPAAPAGTDRWLQRPTGSQIDAALAALDLESLNPAQVVSVHPPAWQRNAVALAKPADGPVIALVIDDLGLNRPNTRRTIELPGPLTLALMTYAESLQEFADRARANGHELMVHVPMAPRDPRYDPGPNALRADLGKEELARRLAWGLSRFQGFVGINNHMGSGFTTSIPGMAQVMLELKARGLLYLDSLTVPGAIGAQLADRLGVPFATRDVFIDNDHEDREAIRRQLAQLESIARRRGAAIGIGHPHDATLDELAVWLPEMQRRGFTLVPISALVRTPSGLAVTPKPANGPG